jgi:DNA-binding SARP family transcriptional activator/tetratricopeptide (TPR) repeat protein
MEFGVLGPVEIRAAGRTVDAGHARQRAVLAVLLFELGRVVPADLLVDRVWGEDPPPSIRNALYGYVSRLKAVLACTDDPGVSLSRHQGGYLLNASPQQLDVCRFRSLVASAATGGEDERAAELLREALGLWRGPALAGLASPWLDGMRAGLEMERAAAVLDLNDIRLRQGQHGALVAELARQAAAAPADERLIGQLMLALHRSGRQAEALRRFEQTRVHLAAELGADPGPQLQELHQQILRADPALAVSAPGPRVAAAVPRELPPGVRDFVGRAAELQTLTGMLGQAGDGVQGTVVISAIGGTAGVGKSALALHWAHQVAGLFGDGQLHVNLRGFDPSGSPVTAAEAIRGFLDALGVPPERIPASPEARAALYRSLLATKRMLIVLDNARDEQQVRPLLAASPGTLVLVTSRSQLGGLAATNGARLLTLDVLSHREAVQLLAARLGTARAAAEPGAVGEIADLCACLPLALAVAAARAAARPGFPLAALAAELADSAGRLDALDAGDPAASVRTVFSWSYRQLSTGAARMFRLLGLHPGLDISVPAAASLAGLDEPEARAVLGELTRGCLIAEHVPGRYAFHDLLRSYAAGQAHAHDSQPEREAATGRVLDHYLHTARSAAFLLNPALEPVAVAPPGPGTAPGRPADYQQALAWFENEHHVLLAAVLLAAESGPERHAWQLPWAMTAFLNTRGHYQECAATQRTALAAATRLGDTAGQAVSSRLLADAYSYLGDFDHAAGYYASSLTLYRQLGNRLGEAKVHQGLNFAADGQGRYADALSHAEQALRLYQAIGHKAGEAEMLNVIGWNHGLLGDYQQARTFCQRSLALNAEVGDRLIEGSIWDSLGYAEHHLGNLSEATACYQRALSIARESGDRRGEAATLTHLGDTRRDAGELPQARKAWQQALAILEDLQHPDADQTRAKLASADSR